MTALVRSWELRNAIVASLELVMDEIDGAIRAASPADLIEFIDSFSPARAPGPGWVLTFDRVVEQLWCSLDADRIAGLEREYRQRGPMWAAVANSFAPERGEKLSAVRWRPHGARRAAVVLR